MPKVYVIHNDTQTLIDIILSSAVIKEINKYETNMCSDLNFTALKVCCRAINKLCSLGKMHVGGLHSIVILDESKFSHKRKVVSS